MKSINENRKFMHCPSFEGSMAESDQKKGVTAPRYDDEKSGDLIELPSFDDVLVTGDYLTLLDARKSERIYTDEPMTQEQLAFMLWSAQGIKSTRGEGMVSTFRPVPSGGARHPFDLYVAVRSVTGLENGFYHYLPTKNVGEKKVTIERLGPLMDDYETGMNKMVVGQKWVVKAPVVLFVSCTPYRAEWRYVDAAHRVMLIDLGHLGQNLMLSATAMGLGSCCLAAYHQEYCDEIFGLNSIDEYTVYALPVGKLKQELNV